MKPYRIRHLFLGVLLLFFAACGASRPPVPPGIVPEPRMVSPEDERYGHEVLNLLTQSTPLDRDDARINRVRRIVDTLTAQLQNQSDPWHIYVLKDDSIKNAAATRGNYVFVWSGMVNEVQSDGELAAILAHEMGHVLAQHTEASPQEEVTSIISGVAGQVAHEVVAAQGEWGLLAGLAQMLIEESINAMLINPELQDKELEADQIGVYLMADAGYDPQEALNFWERVKNTPDFSDFPVQFLSSHPSSGARIEGLKKNLPAASERYRNRGNPDTQSSSPRASPSGSRPEKQPLQPGSGSEWDWGTDTKSTAPNPSNDFTNADSFSTGSIVAPNSPGLEPTSRGESVWEVVSQQVAVFSSPSPTASSVKRLVKGTHVTVTSEIVQRNPARRWLKIINPATGFVESKHLAPVVP